MQTASSTTERIQSVSVRTSISRTKGRTRFRMCYCATTYKRKDKSCWRQHTEYHRENVQEEQILGTACVKVKGASERSDNPRKLSMCSKASEIHESGKRVCHVLGIACAAEMVAEVLRVPDPQTWK
jgi:hypothetical protein